MRDGKRRRKMKTKKRVTAESFVTEAHIEQTITEWLALDGWYGLKTTPVSNRACGVGFGELGMADYQYRRYNESYPGQPVNTPSRSMTQTVWIEFKKPSGRVGIRQYVWIKRERERGALVLLVGENCPSTIEGIQDWYRKSGLMRKLI